MKFFDKKKTMRRVIFFIVFFVSALLFTDKLASDTWQQTFSVTHTAKPDTLIAETIIDFQYSKLYSPYAVLIDLKENKLLFEKNSREIIYPASLTKIMTAIVAIESLDDLNKEILLADNIFPDLYEQGASMAGFLPGEKVTAIDLLYGDLLPSGAECSLALAVEIAGSESRFAELMNKKAQELGMRDTHFVNASGLHNQNHYSTVYDISLLLRYALENETFAEIFTSEDYACLPTNLHSDGIIFQSTMFKNMAANHIKGGRILGGKTGYTSAAGLCLASLAEKDGKQYILITAGAPGNHMTEQYNITDAFLVYSGF